MFVLNPFRIKLYPSIESSLVGRLQNQKSTFYFRNEFARDFQIPATTEVFRIADILLTSYLPDYIVLGGFQGV